jgi:hypothetical protein
MLAEPGVLPLPEAESQALELGSAAAVHANGPLAVLVTATEAESTAVDPLSAWKTKLAGATARAAGSPGSTVKVTATVAVCGAPVALAGGACTVTAPWYVPALSPAGLMLHRNDAGAFPDAVALSHAPPLAAAVKVIDPVPVLTTNTDCGEGAAAPSTTVKLRLAGATPS